VEAVEDAEETLPDAPGGGGLRILGRPYRRDKQRVLATIGIPAAAPGDEQCILGTSGSKEILQAVSTSSHLTEPPDADPHVRWCGRGRVARPSPIPIVKKSRGDLNPV
jgi:hypothetical protein